MSKWTKERHEVAREMANDLLSGNLVEMDLGQDWADVLDEVERLQGDVEAWKQRRNAALGASPEWAPSRMAVLETDIEDLERAMRYVVQEHGCPPGESCNAELKEPEACVQCWIDAAVEGEE